MFARPASPFKQLLSRPGSPERRDRSPYRTQSPERLASPSKQRWFGSITSHAPASLSRQGSSSRQGAARLFTRSDRDGDDCHTPNGRASPTPSSLRPPSVYTRDTYAGSSDGDSAAPLTPGSSAITMAEHFDVVLENEEDHAILPYLGEVVLDLADNEEVDDGLAGNLLASSSSSSIHPVDSSSKQRSTVFSKDLFEATLNELLETERSYVQRIDVLFKRYAQPLRQMAKDKDTAIVPMYEAQRLFGNIGEVLGANMAFLQDLEAYMSNRKHTLDDAFDLAEVLYRNMTCMSCYNEYLANFEKAKHIDVTMTKANRGYRDFAERTKYSIRNLGNVGLRELLMEPIQRIPRYTLLIQGIIKSLPSSDPACSRLDQALLLASRIAKCEVDDKMKRAAVLWSLSRHVEGFPPSLISVNRRLIDCIDVDDYPNDGLVVGKNPLLSPGMNAGQQYAYRQLHCTLLLFDDVLIVAKRAHGNTCSRELLGLDNLNRLADQMKTHTEKSGPGITKSPARPELAFRGLLDLCDVHVSDRGGVELMLTMAKAPLQVTGEKWASRFIRHYIAIETNERRTLGTNNVRDDKTRFIQQLWLRQALYKAIDQSSHARCHVIPASPEEERVKKLVYYNIYSDRQTYAMEPRKANVALHVDIEKSANPLSEGDAPPKACMRLHRIDEDDDICAFSIQSQSELEEADTDVQGCLLSEISSQMKSIAEKCKSAPDSISRYGSPGTPGSSHRGSKGLSNGLEQFGRSLFGTPSSVRSSAAGSDLFGVRRARSKGSSQFSRNPSTSTRMTYSTVNTSSVGSRDMMSKSSARGSPQGGDPDIIAAVARYRNQSPSQRTPSGTNDVELSEHPSTQNSSPSPIRRKPVPLLDPNDGQRRTSSGSKRNLPVELENCGAPIKRQVVEIGHTASQMPHSPQMKKKEADADGEAAKENEDLAHVEPQYSPSRRREQVSPLSVRNTNFANLNGALPKSTSAGSELSTALGAAGKASQQTINQVGHEAQADLEIVHGAVEAALDSLKNLLRQMNSRGRTDVGACVSHLEKSLLLQGRIQSSVAALLAAAIQNEGRVEQEQNPSQDKLMVERLTTQVAALSRKCDKLAELEKDGRLENSALHNAFNEELDRMYDDANLGEVEQIAALRKEVTQAKAQRNEANATIRALQKELALEKAQSELWRASLVKHNLI